MNKSLNRIIKLCIISSADDKILQRFISSLRNITQQYECFILRNKPTNVTFPDNPFITMKIVENEEYRKYDMIQLLKLRIDSVKLANPSSSDIIMLGDDDMYFENGFNFDNIYTCMDNNVEFILGREWHKPMYWNDCLAAGIHKGQYMIYNKDIWDDIEKYEDYVGGGEDGLIAAISYKHNKGKCIYLNIPYCVHIGYNTFSYLQLHNDKTIAWLLRNDKEFNLSLYDNNGLSLYNNLENKLKTETRIYIK